MFYSFLRVVIRFALLIWRRPRVIGEENIPATGGLVVVANHVSNLDPIVMGCAINRQVHFMAKVELFKNVLLAAFLRTVGTFPVNREKSDRNAIRMALELLQAGRVVGIFPEGTRSKTGELLKPHIGAAMLAVKADVPILPMAIIGTEGLFKKIIVVIGEPVYFPELWHSRPGREELEELSMQVMGSIETAIKSDQTKSGA
ncbi:lysophospholipid acyltransferase family protein [Desulforamulus aquiferis]|uniref:1-acyl-sn-glycerol-3-phosphate acyltransferase n=1 Tax=Desulforamulus aquiferis TaxID=1397668 RepID=A0AAW7ZBL3_9FIRM|nr:lysophospholipid acyltransferase family protein [Desulforamulus aquiferis]MDO7786486.1 lysophospholipid acyltransferase family protein [Desulforamulus aquiferis]RYD02936.1 hypothetical protein N752_22380 [Desulforamulus aquiferis]